jgi:3-methyladenine DNA glycosylase AlkC
MSEGALAQWFDRSLALRWDELLSDHCEHFDSSIERFVRKSLTGKSYSQRLDVFATAFEQCLPVSNFSESCAILQRCFGPENELSTGMFSNFYWLLPVSRFIQRHGHQDVSIALDTIGELTKRLTGEYAIRPLARDFPEVVLKQCRLWADSSSFHQRRLATEGLRPYLPWAAKLTVYLDDPLPVLQLLEQSLGDDSLYVRKSVSNHASDYFRLDHIEACDYINSWRKTYPTASLDVFKRLDKRLQTRTSS